MLSLNRVTEAVLNRTAGLSNNVNTRFSAQGCGNHPKHDMFVFHMKACSYPNMFALACSGTPSKAIYSWAILFIHAFRHWEKKAE